MTISSHYGNVLYTDVNFAKALDLMIDTGVCFQVGMVEMEGHISQLLVKQALGTGRVLVPQV